MTDKYNDKHVLCKDIFEMDYCLKRKLIRRMLTTLFFVFGLLTNLVAQTESIKIYKETGVAHL